MKIILKEEPAGPRILALGTFDGVHLGHQKLLNSARVFARKRDALLRVCTFDRHPLDVCLPGKAPKLLTTLPEKLELLARFGAAETQLMRFTRRTADMEPEDFMKWLRSSVDLRGIAVGWNYSFGRGGKGTPELLLRDGIIHGYPVLVLPPVRSADGEEVSSSRIREALGRGEAELVAELLNHDCCFSGPVVEGKHMGRKIGFPTANVGFSPKKMLPAFGVYICWMDAEDIRYPAMVNIGTQPTLPSGHVTMEVHALRRVPELYGRNVRVTILQRLRPEIRFDSPEALVAQMKKDREVTKSFFRMG